MVDRIHHRLALLFRKLQEDTGSACLLSISIELLELKNVLEMSNDKDI